jgi:hypothetical protein
MAYDTAREEIVEDLLRLVKNWRLRMRFADLYTLPVDEAIQEARELCSRQLEEIIHSYYGSTVK